MEAQQNHPSIEPTKGGEVRDKIMETIMRNPAGVTIEEIKRDINVAFPELNYHEIDEVIEFMISKGYIEWNVSLLKKRLSPMPNKDLY